MIERSNSRLNIIFTLWFLAIALVPLALLTLLFNNFRQIQSEQSAFRELATAARSKTDQLESLIRRTASVLGAEAPDPSASRSLLQREVATDDQVVIILVGPGGAVAVTLGGTPPPLLWLTGASLSGIQVHVEDDRFFIAVPSADRWRVAAYPISVIDDLLHRDINDVKYFVPERSDASGGVGRTADMVLADASGTVLTHPLDSDRGALGETLSSPSFQSWNNRSERSPLDSVETISGRSVLLHARPLDLAGRRMSLLVTIDRSEVWSRVSSVDRAALLIGILTLALILTLLYVFVRRLGGMVVRPIYTSITTLMNSSRRIQEGIDAMVRVVETQEKVMKNLSNNYRAELSDIRAVNEAMAAIVSALRGIGRETALAARSVALIKQLAAESQEQGRDARDSLQSIKRLATSNDRLLLSLSHYGLQVDGIANDMKQLSEAIKYISLNAAIDANKGKAAQSLSGLVSEIGRLSLLSKDASARINELVTSMQGQLTQTRHASERERHEAVTSLSVINKALQSLQRMSRDTMKISESVRVINEKISNQMASVSQIAVQSDDLTRKAHGILTETKRISSLAYDQKKTVQSNVYATRRLVAIISKLSQLIGAKNEQRNGSAEK